MTPEQQAIVISKRVQGVSIRDIEAQTGINRGQIDRLQQQPDTRSRIQAEAEKIINGGLKVSRQAILRASAETLRQYKAVTDKQPYDKDLIKLGIDASKTVLAVAGLTGQPSTVINTLINVNQAPEQGQAISLLAEFLKAKQITAQPKCIQSIQVDNKYPGGEGNNIQEAGINASHAGSGLTELSSLNQQVIDIDAEAVEDD